MTSIFKAPLKMVNTCEAIIHLQVFTCIKLKMSFRYQSALCQLYITTAMGCVTIDRFTFVFTTVGGKND